MTATQVQRADAVINVLSRLWPNCFQVSQQRRRLLAIGIDKVLMTQMEPAIKSGRVSENDIRRALQRYVGAIGYQENLAIIGNARIGLDGQLVGIVTEDQAQRARGLVAYRHKQKLERRAAASGENGAGEQHNAELEVGTKRNDRARGQYRCAAEPVKPY